MNIVNNILDLAKERGIKQSFLEELIGGYRGKITEWKKGKSTATDEEVKKIAKYFNVSTDYLLGLTSEKQNNLINREEWNMTTIFKNKIKELMKHFFEITQKRKGRPKEDIHQIANDISKATGITEDNLISFINGEKIPTVQELKNLFDRLVSQGDPIIALYTETLNELVDYTHLSDNEKEKTNKNSVNTKQNDIMNGFFLHGEYYEFVKELQLDQIGALMISLFEYCNLGTENSAIKLDVPAKVAYNAIKVFNESLFKEHFAESESDKYDKLVEKLDELSLKLNGHIKKTSTKEHSGA